MFKASLVREITAEGLGCCKGIAEAREELADLRQFAERESRLDGQFLCRHL